MQQLTLNVADTKLKVLLDFLQTLDYVEILNTPKTKKSKMSAAEMAVSFRIAAQDPEMQRMVEEGLEDYIKITKP
jgi:hypothetical protein